MAYIMSTIRIMNPSTLPPMNPATALPSDTHGYRCNGSQYTHHQGNAPRIKLRTSRSRPESSVPQYWPLVIDGAALMALPVSGIKVKGQYPRANDAGQG